MIIHAAVIVSLLTLVGDRALADGRWYIGHFGQEVCIPLNDIGNNGTRAYYGAGNMRNPEDFARFMASVGYNMRSVPTTQEGVRLYATRISGDRQDSFFILFNNKDLCAERMSHAEP